MTIIKEDFTDVALGGADVTVSFHGRPIRPASTETGLVTPRRVPVRAVDGKITSPELDPGPCEVLIETGRWKREYSIVVPLEGSHRLRELIDTYEVPDPPVVSLVKKYRDEVVATAKAVDESLVVYGERLGEFTERAETASGAAEGFARAVGEDAAAAARDREVVEELGRAVAGDRETVVEVGDQVARDRAAVEEAQTGISTAVADASASFEEYRVAFTADREIAQRASGEAVRQADRAEAAADDIAEGVVPDGGVTTAKLVDGAVTLSKTSVEVQAAIGKGQSAIQPSQLAAAIAALQDQAPGALDTFYEVAAAIGNDPNFRQTILDQIATRAADSDVVKLSVPQVVPSAKNFTDGLYVDEQRVVTTDDFRLGDSRVPTAHTHKLTETEGYDDFLGFLVNEFERVQSGLNAKVSSYPGQVIVNWAGTQAAFDALPASEKTAAGFISVIY